MRHVNIFERRTPMQRDASPTIPLVRPNPPKLSGLLPQLAALEASGIFSNYGPVNTQLEREFLERMFHQTGACVTVCNATIGLMSALKHVALPKPSSRNFALMPAFTFAAAAHAALWAGLTPLLCDIDPNTWTPSPESEDRLLEQFGSDIAVIFPYATFGNCIDLDRYDAISRRYRIPVVIDAAASLGTLAEDGRAFGTGGAHPVVFSMHATKAFAVGEAGLVYCADRDVINAIRAMGNFGFGQPRSATMPGINSKLPEITALIALAKLREFDILAAYRSEIAQLYRAELPGWTFQEMHGLRHAQQFMPVLLPETLAGRRHNIIAELASRGIGAATYFSPHLAQQPYFQQTCLAGDLTNTHDIAARIISLPISDFITPEEVSTVARALQQISYPSLASIPLAG